MTRSINTCADRAPATSPRGAYTIIELLVVIVIAVLLLTIAVPAFQASIYSSNRSLAANAIQAASVMARDVAINTGKDGAVVFVYDPEVRRLNIIPAIKVGTIREASTAPTGPGGGRGPGAVAFGQQPYFDIDVFVAAPIGEVLSLPADWMVRGYAPAGLMIDVDSGGNEAATWYNSQMYGGDDPNSSLKEEGHWVFPETGLFARDAQVNGGGLNGDLSSINRTLATARQSFMIRFDARTGAVSRDTRSALFVDPRNSSKRPYGRDLRRLTPNQLSLRVDQADDIEVWASRVLNSADVTGDGITYGRDDGTLREQLIGNASNDTILVKPVARLALYDEKELAAGVGARGVNTETGTLYLPQDQSISAAMIQLDTSLITPPPSQQRLAMLIDQWINGDTNGDGVISFNPLNPNDEPDDPQARQYLVQSYTGELKEVLQ